MHKGGPGADDLLEVVERDQHAFAREGDGEALLDGHLACVAHAERVGVRVLGEEQVVVGRVCVQPVLEGVGVLVPHPPQPPHVERSGGGSGAQSSDSQSRVSMISRTRARNAAA